MEAKNAVFSPSTQTRQTDIIRLHRCNCMSGQGTVSVDISIELHYYCFCEPGDIFSASRTTQLTRTQYDNPSAISVSAIDDDGF